MNPRLISVITPTFNSGAKIAATVASVLSQRRGLYEFLSSAARPRAPWRIYAHLAAAAKRPVVMISCHPKNGSLLEDTSPARFGPFGAECRVVQPESLLSPCQGKCCSHEPHCILAVTSEKVIAAVDDLIQEIGMASPPPVPNAAGNRWNGRRN
jgi:hypothetical protein